MDPERPLRIDVRDGAHLDEVVAAPAPASLIVLRLQGAWVDPAALAAIGAWMAVPKLRAIFFGGATDGDGCLSALAAAPVLPRLERVYADGCGITSAGVATLAGASGATSLGVLYLANRTNDWVATPNRVDDDGARALASSPYLGALYELDLGNNPVGDAGAEALVTSKTLRVLRQLNLWGTAVTREWAMGTDARVRMLLHTDHDIRTIRWDE